MGAVVQRTPVIPPARRTPTLTAIEGSRHVAPLHLFTYVVGNALFWLAWTATFVSADTWYWWLTVPTAGWTLVLGLHLLHVRLAR